MVKTIMKTQLIINMDIELRKLLDRNVKKGDVSKYICDLIKTDLVGGAE